MGKLLLLCTTTHLLELLLDILEDPAAVNSSDHIFLLRISLFKKNPETFLMVAENFAT
jgi:hypothetical protein